MTLVQDLMAKVLDLEGNEVGDMALPDAFGREVRDDLIRRAVVVSQSRRVQPQGRDPRAGKRTTAKSRGVGYGIARVPRIHGSGTARLAPMTVKGRSTHPPKAEKVIRKGFNRKERLLALASALSATAVPDRVKARGHILGERKLPLIVSRDAQDLERTSRVIEVLQKLGFGDELDRCLTGRKRVKSGMRAPRGPLIVVGERCRLVKAARAIPGVDIVAAQELCVEDLAPGGVPGRLTIWVGPALEVVAKRLQGGGLR
jgi:large subunit ribosomal protein L4e